LNNPGHSILGTLSETVSVVLCGTITNPIPSFNTGKEDAEGSPSANTDLTTWVPPTSTPAEVRQYRRELHEKIDALPFSDGPASSTRFNADADGIDSNSDDEPLNS
jgi:hypothetical protein